MGPGPISAHHGWGNGGTTAVGSGHGIGEAQSAWGDPCVSRSLSSPLCAPILVQTERAQLEDGRFVYRLLRSPMCEYLVNFLHKLRQLPERYMMNSVLENFTILQVRHWGWADQGSRYGGECPQQPLSPGTFHLRN